MSDANTLEYQVELLQEVEKYFITPMMRAVSSKGSVTTFCNERFLTAWTHCSKLFVHKSMKGNVKS